jgi:molecular chaperone GrpE
MEMREQKNLHEDQRLSPPGKSPGEDLPTFHVVDKRHFINLDGPLDAAVVEEKPRYPTFVEELMARVAEAQRRFEEKKKLMDEEIRRSRERLEGDFQRKLQIERQKLLFPFLEILDNLRRALESGRIAENQAGFTKGIEMIAAQFETTLQAQGVEAFPVLNLPYDPNLGQAVGVLPVDDPRLDGVVIEEVVRGYRMGDQLMRPAQVRVGQLQPGAEK